MKGIIFFLIFVAGLASAYTPEQQTILNETTLNETKLNATALNETKLNATALNEIKLNATALNETRLNKPPLNGTKLNETTPKASDKFTNPFKAGSDLSKFRKKQVRDFGPQNSQR
jgi:hypothetical protein